VHSIVNEVLDMVVCEVGCSGVWEQFWLDFLVDATIDSYRCQI